MKAGHYENNPDSVHIMIHSSREVISDLVSFGVSFEKDGDEVKKGQKRGLVRGDIRVLLSGERTALNIFSSLNVKQFIEGVRTGKSTELMNITGGYHYHTVRADSEEILDKIEKALEKRGYIAPEI